MKVEDLKKNVNKSVRINDEVLKIIENKGLTLQSYLDQCLGKLITIVVEEKS